MSGRFTRVSSTTSCNLPQILSQADESQSGDLPYTVRRRIQSNECVENKRESNISSRDGVKSTWIPWMASADAPQAHPHSVSRPVPLYRLICILRTGWMEAAIAPQERRNPSLIEPYKEQEDRSQSSPLPDAVLVWARVGGEKCCSTKKTGKGVVNLNVRRLSNRRAGNHDAVPSRLDLVHAQSYRFTHPPLYTVPKDRLTNAAAHRKAKAAVGKTILQNAQYGNASAIRSALATDLLEPAVFPYSKASSHAAQCPKDSVNPYLQTASES